jgi:hypothetical protein
MRKALPLIGPAKSENLKSSAVSSLLPDQVLLGAVWAVMDRKPLRFLTFMKALGGSSKGFPKECFFLRRGLSFCLFMLRLKANSQ